MADLVCRSGKLRPRVASFPEIEISAAVDGPGHDLFLPPRFSCAMVMSVHCLSSCRRSSAVDLGGRLRDVPEERTAQEGDLVPVCCYCRAGAGDSPDPVCAQKSDRTITPAVREDKRERPGK